jgi:hypothetical protein
MSNLNNTIPIDPVLIGLDAAERAIANFDDVHAATQLAAMEALGYEVDAHGNWQDEEMPELVGEQWENDGPRTTLGHGMEWGAAYEDITPTNSSSSAWYRDGSERRIDFSRVETLDLTATEAPRNLIYDTYDDEDDVPASSGIIVEQTTPIMRKAQSNVIDMTNDSSSDTDLDIMHPRLRTRHNPKKTSFRDVAMAGLEKPTLAMQLKHDDPITFPQVIGKRAYLNPSILDEYIATPALQVLLEEQSLPAEVLWASFLKNNAVYLDCSAACDIMGLWLDHAPHRYKNVTKLILDDFLYHPRVRKQNFAPERYSMYRPIKLVAKCPNLHTLEMIMWMATFPGITYSKRQDIQFRAAAMAKEFDKRFKMRDLMSVVSRGIRKMVLFIYVTSAKEERQCRDKFENEWKREIREYFLKAAQTSGWPKDERRELDFDIVMKKTR